MQENTIGTKQLAHHLVIIIIARETQSLRAKDIYGRKNLNLSVSHDWRAFIFTIWNASDV